MNANRLSDRLYASALAMACAAIQKNGLPSTMQDEAALARVCVRGAIVLIREHKKQMAAIESASVSAGNTPGAEP